MGAQLWYHLAPWRPDPADALRALQAAYLEENYELPSLVQTHLESAREAVRLSEEEGDPYGLLDLYRDKLALLEGVAIRPLPDEPVEQIALVRSIFADSGEGIGNVLDVTSVTESGGLHVARRLRADEVHALCGVGWPTLERAEAAVSEINVRLGRGESVCFPVHADDGAPAGWYFVGNTVD